METHSSRKGFTLVELLVVIAIIGVLVALLLPAIQAAREAARRSKCTNNLKQIAVAIQNYHDTFTSFPSGGMHFVASGDRQEWGWPALILPFMEQTALHEQLGVTERHLWDVLNNEPALVQTVIKSYRCPTDTTKDLVDKTPQARDFNGYAPVGTNFFGATSNYMGVVGIWDIDVPINGGPDNNGTLYINSEVATQDILDGTSNTFLVGERNFACSAGTWAGGRNSDGAGPRGPDYMLGRVSLKPNGWNIHGQTGNDSCTEAFSSYHPGGLLFAYCDGTVSFISQDIDFDNGGAPFDFNNAAPGYNNVAIGTYQRLGARDDGQPLPDY